MDAVVSMRQDHSIAYGILSSQLNFSLKDCLDQKFDFKVYLAENFTALELKASGLDDLRSWQSGNTAEVEFILPLAEGPAIPVEVKSGKNTKAKSFNLYREKFKPVKAAKLVGSSGGACNNTLTLPLFYAGKIPEIPA